MKGAETMKGAEMARTVEFAVTGEQKIHCAGCEQRIGAALRRLPGVKDARANAETQRVVVTFDPARLSPDQVRKTIERLGYQVAG